MENKDKKTEPLSLSKQSSLLLQQGRIKDTIVLLRRKVKGLLPLPQKLDEIESTYTLLTKYFLDGIKDESRESILGDIKLQLLDIADRIERHNLLLDNPKQYFSIARMQSFRPDSLQNLIKQYEDLNEKVNLKTELGAQDINEMKLRESYQEKIFNYIWTLENNARTDLKIIRDKILSSELSDSALAFQLVSALLLSSLEWYDREKLSTLIAVYEASSTEQLAARSLTALILILAKYRNRISPDRKLMLQLETLKDSLLTYRRLRESVRSIIRTRDTDRVTSKMRSEVLPSMMQFSPDMLNKIKEASEEGDLDALEENPEWEKMMRKTGLADRIKELSEMQLEGADVMMVAFSNLKGFPFFSKIQNWFLPFSTNLSYLAENKIPEMLDSSNGLSRLLDSNGIICDSDKYSFVFALASMPEDKRSSMAQQLDIQRRQMEEAGFGDGRSSRPEYDIESEKYVRDLYRFFKLYNKKSEFEDPFENPIDFRNLPIVSEILNEEEILELFAAFYFKRGYYREALPMLRQLSEVRGDDAHVWEKLGFALEQTGGRPGEILACYMKAELLSPDSRWLAKRIGKAYAAAGKWNMAVDYLSRAYEDSNIISDLIEIAEIKRLAGNIEEAAKDFYKAHYLAPEDRGILIALTRLEMERGDLSKALKFTRKFENDNPSDAELRLIGHIYLLNKEYRKAADFYSRTIHPEQQRREWKKEILNDWPLLESLGANRDELNLILDYLV